ncbi:MAG: type II toxin-antitoxin system VapC family toxin [Isosphaeraceae bacterium]
MNYLVDTNILTRLADPGHAMHQEALDAVKLLARQGHRLHVIPQNFYEFWVVCTRPKNVNGLGKTAPEAVAELSNLKALFLWPGGPRNLE